MKFTTAIFLLFLLLTQVFSKWLVVLEYNLNKDFIAKTLCINKERPKLHCQGKCQMMKKMAEQEENSSSPTYQFAKASFSDACFNDINDCSITAISVESVPAFSFYNIKNYSSPIASIFHPPSLS